MLYYHGELKDASRFINRMCADYRFGLLSLYGVPHGLQYHRSVVHSMLSVHRRKGSRSALRKMPWYLLKIWLDVHVFV